MSIYQNLLILDIREKEARYPVCVSLFTRMIQDHD